MIPSIVVVLCTLVLVREIRRCPAAAARTAEAYVSEPSLPRTPAVRRRNRAEEAEDVIPAPHTRPKQVGMSGGTRGSR